MISCLGRSNTDWLINQSLFVYSSRCSNLLSNFCLIACGFSQTLFIMPSVNKMLDQKQKLTSKPFWLLNHDWLDVVLIQLILFCFYNFLLWNFYSPTESINYFLWKYSHVLLCVVIMLSVCVKSMLCMLCIFSFFLINVFLTVYSHVLTVLLTSVYYHPETFNV